MEGFTEEGAVSIGFFLHTIPYGCAWMRPQLQTNLSEPGNTLILNLALSGLLFGSWIFLSAVATFLLLAPDEWIGSLNEAIPSLQVWFCTYPAVFLAKVHSWRVCSASLQCLHLASPYD